MRKIKIILFALFCSILVGCGKYGEKDLIKDFSKKISTLDSYKLEGVLEIYNNEDKFVYDINVNYKKNDKFKVSLKNQINNYEQIIVRNDTGVYV